MSDYIKLWQTWTDIEPYKLKDSNKNIQGYSIAGLRTNFFIYPDLMLDAGISAPFSPKIILITHGHSDHTANLPFHLYRSDLNLEPIKIFCPKEIKDFLNNYIVSMFQMSDCNNEVIPHGYEIIGIDENTPSIELMINKQLHLLEFYKCDHTVPCIGYGISLIKNKLKKEYIGLSTKEIKELKMQNVEITERIYEHELFYGGDTTHKLFDDYANKDNNKDNNKDININKNIFKYKNIMIECTFVHEDDITHAENKKHMHWLNLKKFVESNISINWILMHFSQKYKKKDIEEFFINENLSNIKLWCNIK